MNGNIVEKVLSDASLALFLYQLIMIMYRIAYEKNALSSM